MNITQLQRAWHRINVQAVVHLHAYSYDVQEHRECFHLPQARSCHPYFSDFNRCKIKIVRCRYKIDIEINASTIFFANFVLNGHGGHNKKLEA